MQHNQLIPDMVYNCEESPQKHLGGAGPTVRAGAVSIGQGAAHLDQGAGQALVDAHPLACE